MQRANQISRRSLLVTGSSIALTSWASSASPMCDANHHADAGWQPTGTDVEGPFFREGAPQRSVLHRGVEHEILTVHGTVFGRRAGMSYQPIASARIEIWHASPTGLYDNHTDAQLYRGHFFTDANGAYQFETAIPMGYKDGPYDRPAHIHYKVLAEGFKTFTTQLYFQGDPKMKDDVFVNRNNGYARAVLLKRLSPGLYQSRFDIRLAA